MRPRSVRTADTRPPSVSIPSAGVSDKTRAPSALAALAYPVVAEYGSAYPESGSYANASPSPVAIIGAISRTSSTETSDVSTPTARCIRTFASIAARSSSPTITKYPVLT